MDTFHYWQCLETYINVTINHRLNDIRHFVDNCDAFEYVSPLIPYTEVENGSNLHDRVGRESDLSLRSCELTKSSQ